MAKFKVVTPAGVSYGAPAASYELEMEALGPLGAEIVEVAAKTEDDFAKAAGDADALYAKGRPITKRIIDGLERCKVIALGSVGVDSVDVAAATERGIPVTNVPDTFIEEVADHAMTLIRSEEHTSELQSLAYLVCRLLLEKKKTRATKDALTSSEGNGER